MSLKFALRSIGKVMMPTLFIDTDSGMICVIVPTHSIRLISTP